VTLLRSGRRSTGSAAALADATSHSQVIRLSDGRTLGFDDFGSPGGYPILFFHGFASSRVLRHPDDSIAGELGLRMIAPDRPGIGYSTRQPRRRLVDWAADVDQLASAVGIGRFGVLAWSGGGPYALACAWAMPQRVSAVAVVSASAPLAGVPDAKYLYRMHRVASRAAGYAPWMIRLAMWRWARAQRSDPQRQLDEAIESMVAADQAILQDPRLRAVMLANTTELQRQGGRGLYDEALVIARRWGFPLSAIRVPVHVWHGEADVTVPAEMGRYIAQAVPGSRSTFYPQEGHHLLYDRWAEILTTLAQEGMGPATRR
jgi:pimeloyl-ACP methyl ester carboxylesterase